MDKTQSNQSRTQQGLNRQQKWYVAGFIIGAIVFIPALIISLSHHLTGLNARIFYDLNNLSNSYKTAALWLTEGLGAGYAIAACVLIPLLFKRFRLAWRFFFTVGGAGVVMEIAKYVVKEPRPVLMLHGHLHERAVETGFNSFPSGHATVATALALIVWMLLPKAWRWLPIVWIAIVCLSRVYLGDHTPLDVLGGIGVGLMAVSFVQLLPHSLAKKLRLDNDKPLLSEGWEGVDISRSSSAKTTNK